MTANSKAPVEPVLELDDIQGIAVPGFLKPHQTLIGLKLPPAEGLARAKVRGHGLVILVGDAPYYARVGFQKLPEGQLLMPGPVDPQRFLYVELVPGALAGMHGVVLPPHRFAEISVPFAIPHQAERQKQSAECQ